MSMKDNKFNPDDFDSNFADDTRDFWYGRKSKVDKKEGYHDMIDTHIKFITSNDERRKSYSNIFVDPDRYSKKLIACHKAAWGDRELPNGKSIYFELGNKLQGKIDEEIISFGSDTIFTNFIGYDCYHKNKFKEIFDAFPSQKKYQEYLEKNTKNLYTGIGGFIIYPTTHSFNCARGNKKYCDRFDLALYCIYKHYRNEKSPLSNVLSKNKDFFDLFVNTIQS